MKNLIAELKQNNEDMEWYPTTNEIIECMAKHIDGYSILDIGAGNGKVFKKLNELQKEKKNSPFECYAIEKSQILINQLPADVFVIGTDFHRQTLIDKKVDVVFCNPPYSEYEQWAVKIIEQANCKQIFLVIPERWKENKRIMHAIRGRKWVYKTLGSFDFLNAERQARAKVNLIMFEKIMHRGIHDSEKRPETIDPFEYWFDITFKINLDKKDYGYEYESEKSKKQEIKNALVTGEGLVPRLVELYDNDMKKLLDNYRQIEKLDGELLKELGVDLEKVKESLKHKIENLKHLYWQELFNNLDKITDRLTSKSREEMLNTLTDNTSVDFTCENAYAIVIWVIKNANKYFDKQLLKMYLKITDKENIRNYKSNKKLIEDGWRYEKDKHSHYYLDYRLVVRMYCFESSFSGLRFTSDARDFLDDIIVIGKNLGFNITDLRARDRNFSRGLATTFAMFTGEVFMEVRPYKNGNLHIKLNQKFMQAFNIEAGRLNGWLKDPQHASDELGIPIENAVKHFKTNFILENKNVKLLENLQSANHLGAVSSRGEAGRE